MESQQQNNHETYVRKPHASQAGVVAENVKSAVDDVKGAASGAKDEVSAAAEAAKAAAESEKPKKKGWRKYIIFGARREG